MPRMKDTEPREANPAERGPLIATITIGVHRDARPGHAGHILHYKEDTSMNPQDCFELSPAASASILAQVAMSQAEKTNELLANVAGFFIEIEEMGYEPEEALATLRNLKEARIVRS